MAFSRWIVRDGHLLVYLFSVSFQVFFRKLSIVKLNKGRWFPGRVMNVGYLISPLRHIFIYEYTSHFKFLPPNRS